MVNVGIVGIGMWGKNLLSVFNSLSNVVGVSYKKDKETKDWLKNNYPSIASTKNYEELLKNKELEVIVIATPIKTHYRIAKDAILAKKHVFVEKPLATNPQEVRELYRLAKKNGVVLFVGYIYLHHPCYLKLLTLVDPSEIVSIKTKWKKFGSFNEDIFYNLAVHDISIIIDLIGAIPKEVKIKKIEGIKTKADILCLELIFQNNTALIEINRVSDKKEKKIIIETNIGEKLIWTENVLSMKTIDKKEQIILENKKETLKEEIMAFLACIKKNISPDEEVRDVFIAESIKKLSYSYV